jgi:hypothetical protein
MRKFIFMIIFTLASIGLVSQSSQAQNLSAPNTTSINDTARTAITPYVQAVPNDSYTFMAFSHPSLDTAATQIGLIVEVVGMSTVPDSTSGASVNFTVDAGETHRVFVVNNTHATINSSNSAFTDARTHLILTADTAQFGSARITGIRTTPMTADANSNFDNVGQISMWGVVFIPSSGTGFAMEFVGDAHDSTIPFGIAGDSLKAVSGTHTGAGRGIN